MTTGSVAVAGGGLAGLAAAVTLAEAGRTVELFESRRHLGGRATSFHDARLDTLVDHCQHVAMGCCTHLLDFCRRTRLADAWQPQPRLHFLGPDGTQHDFQASRWLPVPLHLLPGLLALGYLSLRERLVIGRTILRLASGSSQDDPNTQETIGQWLRRQKVPQRAIEQFFSVVLTSALGETVDRASLAAARQVFAQGFLMSRGAHQLILPKAPLRELFDHRLSGWLAEHGVTVHRAARVRRIEGDGDRVDTIVLADGSRRRFERIIVAAPWRQVRGLFSPEVLSERLPELAGVDHIEASPITAVHLWFDRPALPLPHAVLVGRLGHWVLPSSHGWSNARLVVPGRHQCLAGTAATGSGRTSADDSRRTRRDLAGSPTSPTGPLAGRNGAGGGFLRSAGLGRLPSGAAIVAGKPVLCRRLDGHRLARHDGRRRPQRPTRRRGGFGR